MIREQNKMLGGILLVAGTTIGAGILALPIVTGQAGAVPSTLLFLLFWGYMTYTAFLILEVNLWMGENVNLITMASHTLGRVGKGVCWIAYLFLLYLLTTAYLAGGGPIVSRVIAAMTGICLPPWAGGIPLLLIFSFFVYEGTKFVDYLNRFLMVGLVLAYGAMMLFLIPHIEVEYFSHTNWKYPLLAISTVATSFGFHIIIPSLTTYLHRDVSRLCRSIFFGSVATLLIYLIWLWGTLGAIPLHGPSGIVEGYRQGLDGVALIVEEVGTKDVALFAQIFSFCAVMSSFLGVTLSLSDFLADGFHIKKTPLGRLLLFLCTFTPPALFVLTYPRAFLVALQFAGMFGVVVLLGLFPPLMVWRGRYHKGYVGPFRTKGGRPVLFAMIVISLACIGVGISEKLGILKTFLGGV